MKIILVNIMMTLLLLSGGVVMAQSNVNFRPAAPENGLQEKLDLAREYYANEEYEKALKYLDDLPNQYQTPGEVYKLKLGCYQALGEYDKAERFVKNFIKSRHGNTISYEIDLMVLYLKQGQKDKADGLVDGLLNDIKNNPSLAYGYANAFQKDGYPAIALEMYELAESNMPNANFDYQKAILYGELGDIKKMYATYVDMVERTPTYLSSVKQMLARALREESSTENSDYLKETLIKKIQDGGPQTMNELLVFVFIQEGNFSGAFMQLKALDKRNKGNKGELYNLGQVATNNGEYALAVRIFDYVIAAGEETPFYEQALVSSLEAKTLKLENDGVTDKASWQTLQQDYFSTIQTLKGMPEVGGLTIGLAHLTAFRLNESDTAIGMLRNLLKRGFVSREDVAKAKIELGDILLYNGERWESILLYGQAEKDFEQSPIGQEAKFKRAKAAYYVGDFQWAQGIFDALKESTSKLIANDAMRYSLLINDNIALDTSMEAMAMYAKADLMNYQGKRDSALRLLDMMDIAFPDHSIQDEVVFMKAQILTDQKKYEEAAQAYQQLIELYAKDILADDAIYALAGLYETQLNRRTEAMDLYQKIFTEHPDSFFAPEARKKFREMRGDSVIN